MPLSLTTFKTTNLSYFPQVTGKPAWKLDISANPWDDLMDYLVANCSTVDPTVFSSCHVSLSSNQSIATSGLAQAVSWDQDANQNTATHSTSVNPTRFTVPGGQGGRYQLLGSLGFLPNSAGQRRYEINKNGSHLYYGHTTQGSALSGGNILTVAWYDVLAAGDYIELLAYQDSGGALSVASALTSISFARVG